MQGPFNGPRGGGLLFRRSGHNRRGRGQQRAGGAKAEQNHQGRSQQLLRAEVEHRQADKADGAEPHSASRHNAQTETTHQHTRDRSAKPARHHQRQHEHSRFKRRKAMNKLQLLGHQQLKSDQGNHGGHRHHHAA